MNQIEEQKALIEFLESALQEARNSSNTSPEKLGLIQRKLDEARLDLSQFTPSAVRVETHPVLENPVRASVSVPEPGRPVKLHPEPSQPVGYSASAETKPVLKAPGCSVSFHTGSRLSGQSPPRIQPPH